MDSTDILVPGKRRRVEVSSGQFHWIDSGRMGSAHLQALDSDSQIITTSVTIPPNGHIRLLSDRVYTVGRKKSSCDIILHDIIVSRIHCQFLLDGHSCRLLLTDGLFQDVGPTGSDWFDFFVSKRNFVISNKYSMNGVFVNGQRISRGTAHELFVGDEVCLGCSCRKSRHNNALDSRFGFIVKSIVFFNTHNVIDESVHLSKNDPSVRAMFLLSTCRTILKSKDPISCISESLDIVGIKKQTSLSTTLVYDSHQKINGNPQLSCNDLELGPEKAADCACSSDGKTFYLNRLQFMDPKDSDNCKTISLPELFYPVGSLMRVFIATFICDVLWYYKNKLLRILLLEIM